MIDFKVIYDRKKETKEPNSLGLIEIQAYLRGERVQKYYSTKIKVKLCEWNKKDKKITNKNKDADKHNYTLKRYIKELEDEQFKKGFDNMPFTFEDIKRYFTHKKEKTSSFVSFVNAEIESDLSLSKKTKAQHRNTMNILKQFTPEDILFSDLKYDFLDKFTNYLIGKDYEQNTIHKHHKNLKKFIGLAIKKELTDIKNPYNNYKVKSEQKTRDVLSIKEVEALAKLTFNENETKLKQVRDMFLFACYTGLRISDVCALKPEYIKNLEQGIELDFVTIKVKKRAELPLYKLFTVKDLPSLPEQIINEYLKLQKPFVFPKLSEQFINRQLKDLAGLVGIKIKLTFHIARETFGTYMAGKVEPFYLKRLMQHSDIKTTMRYVHLDKKMMNEKLDKVTSWD